MSGLMSGRQVHIDKMLSQMAINFRPIGGIAMEIVPTISVQKQSDLYPIFSQADLFRNEDDKRARGTEAHKIEVSVSSDSYYADNYALKSDITLEDRINSDPGFIYNEEAGRSMLVLDKLHLNMETRVASLFLNTSNVGSSSAVASGWTDNTNSDPLGNVLTAIDNVADATGYRPNRAIFGEQAWRQFRRNTVVRNASQNPNVSAGDVFPGVAKVMELLELEQILIGGTYRNTAEEAISLSLSQVWGDNVLVYYAPQNASRQVPSFAYYFRWAVAGLPNMQVERLPFNPVKKVDELEIGYYQDEKITSAPLGFLLTAVNSST